jgi:hypothetical protein
MSREFKKLIQRVVGKLRSALDTPNVPGHVHEVWNRMESAWNSSRSWMLSLCWNVDWMKVSFEHSGSHLRCCT